MPKKEYKPREWRLVYEFLITNFRNCLQWRRVRVGPIYKNEKLYQVVRRWADAIVYCAKEDIVYIIEAKMKPEPGGISQLELYIKLFPKTPEFEMLKDKRVKGIYLTTQDDPELRELAKSKGIEYVVYQPDWVKEYWKERLEKYG